MKQLDSENKELLNQIERLKQEKLDLERTFKDHLDVCTSFVHHLPPTPSPDNNVGCVDFEGDFLAFTAL